MGTVPETQWLRRLIGQVQPDAMHLHSAKATGRLAMPGLPFYNRTAGRGW
jgi:hypothetical protein